jgi:hypothetical protein
VDHGFDAIALAAEPGHQILWREQRGYLVLTEVSPSLILAQPIANDDLFTASRQRRDDI